MTAKTSTRPTLQRKVTRKTKEKATDDLNRGLRVEVDGEAFEIRVGDVSPKLARELRRETGMGFMSLLAALVRDPDTDLVSTFVWFARRVRGEEVDIDDVAVGYDVLTDPDRFDVDEAGAEVIAPGPEA